MIPTRIDRNSLNTLIKFQEELANSMQARPRKAQPQSSEMARNLKVTQTYSPAVDIYEDANSIVISVDLPGMIQSEIDIEMVGETLAIRGERKRTGFAAAQAEEKNEANTEASPGKHLRSEQQYGAFERRFTIGVPVQPDLISATYLNGSLEIKVPKAEAAKPKKVLVATE